jgi:hypothetical protein
MEGTHNFWGGHPWGTSQPPDPPSSAPTQINRASICSFLNSASICILIKTWNWSVAEFAQSQPIWLIKCKLLSIFICSRTQGRPLWLTERLLFAFICSRTQCYPLNWHSAKCLLFHLQPHTVLSPLIAAAHIHSFAAAHRVSPFNWLNAYCLLYHSQPHTVLSPSIAAAHIHSLQPHTFIHLQPHTHRVSPFDWLPIACCFICSRMQSQPLWLTGLKDVLSLFAICSRTQGQLLLTDWMPIACCFICSRTQCYPLQLQPHTFIHLQPHTFIHLQPHTESAPCCPLCLV